MGEQLVGEVVHVVPPEDLDDYDLEPELETMATDRYVLVCRKGGAPSWIEKLRMFFLREPIEAVTVVAETAASEGEEITATVVETDLAGVYEATHLERVDA
ncbi:DUF7526 family protein [Halomicrobium salinisoli]|uniref:DUF7526 family protein n=1 Tax=Halomicrobium salinisoli TaxID=2878391 RepID=UPI001CF02557|nr:hypothetical protein [Halomicrobium salinisoli]